MKVEPFLYKANVIFTLTKFWNDGKDFKTFQASYLSITFALKDMNVHASITSPKLQLLLPIPMKQKGIWPWTKQVNCIQSKLMRRTQRNLPLWRTPTQKEQNQLSSLIRVEWTRHRDMSLLQPIRHCVGFIFYRSN